LCSPPGPTMASVRPREGVSCIETTTEETDELVWYDARYDMRANEIG
jgi:hypothetical protein